MRKGLSWLVALFALGACVGAAVAQFPVTYNFPGSGAPTGFTVFNIGTMTGVIANSSGNATLSSGTIGATVYTSATFTSFGVTDQYGQINYTASAGFENQGATSPCVNMVVASGKAVCYGGSFKGFYTVSGGNITGLGASCFFSGATPVKIAVVGNVYTATDSSGNSCNQTITGFSGVGSPGFVLDWSTDVTTRVQNFVGDCYPSSCGVAALPSITPATGSYINAQTVTIATTTPGATLCYTIDGSTPLAATPGTCSHGTTYSSSFSTSGTTPYTETVKAIATISGGTNSAVATSAITVTGITVTAVIPPCSLTNCNVVLPGATRQIFVQDNDVTDTLTWSVVSGSITVSSPNSLPTAEVTLGSTTGVCTITPGSGSPGPYTVTSTTTPVVRATSVNDPTRHADFPFLVCPTTDQVFIFPYYVQIFEGDKIELESQIFGVALVNENVTWSITTQPAGGDGALTDTTFRNTEFTATVPGAYIITATETVSPHSTSTARVWVTAATYPYPNPSSPQGTRIFPADCSDPVFTSTFEIGPSQANTTIRSVVTTTTAAGSCFRLHNEDTTFSSPTVYPEYLQWVNQCTATHPCYFVGVPDSHGNLPVQDGTNSRGNASIAGAFEVNGSGLNLYYAHDSTHGSCFDHYGSECGPSYVTTANIHERNILPTISFYVPGSPTISSIHRNTNTVTAVVSAASNYSQFSGAPFHVVNVTGASTSFNSPSTFTITSTAASTGGSQVLTGTFTGGGSNAFAGQTAIVSQFADGTIDGNFTITASTTTTLTVSNAFANASATGGVVAVGFAGTDTFAVTSAAAASGSSQVLTGNFTGGSSNGFVGQTANVFGFANGANNGNFTVSASTNTTLTVANASGVVDTSGTVLIQTVLVWPQTGANESGTVSGTSEIQEFWGGEFTCNDGRTGDHNQWMGNQMESCPMMIWTNDNVAQYEWGGVSADYFIGYNDGTSNGLAGDQLVHGMYLQGRNFVITGNHIHNPVSGVSGGALKWRGTNGIITYNVLQGAWLRCHDNVEVQGGYPGVSMDGYLNDSDAWADGDTGGAPYISGQQESLFQDFLLGNVCDTTAAQMLHNAGDVDAGIVMRTGQTIYGWNTANMNSQTQIMNNGSNTGLNTSDYFSLRWYPFNNSFWGTAGGSMAVNVYTDFIATFQTNLFSTGAVDITAPIQSPKVGWNYNCDGACPWNNTVPLNTHMSGLTNPNFLTTNTNPITTNYVPISGSALNSAATTPTGIAAQIKVRYYYDLSTNSLKPRTDIVSNWPTTIGAVPGSGGPPPAVSSFLFGGHSKFGGSGILK